MINVNKLMSVVDERIWRKFYPDSDSQGCPPLEEAAKCLYGDIATILCDSRFDSAKAEREILSIIESTRFPKAILDNVPIDKIRAEKALRKDLLSALKNVENGSELAPSLRYTLYDNDIIMLARLHKRNLCREKVEQLLDGCGRHKESAILTDKGYSFFFF